MNRHFTGVPRRSPVSVEEIQLASLWRRFPDGPVHIAGWILNGNAARHIARYQLIEKIRHKVPKRFVARIGIGAEQVDKTFPDAVPHNERFPARSICNNSLRPAEFNIRKATRAILISPDIWPAD